MFIEYIVWDYNVWCMNPSSSRLKSNLLASESRSLVLGFGLPLYSHLQVGFSQPIGLILPYSEMWKDPLIGIFPFPGGMGRSLGPNPECFLAGTRGVF